MKKIQVGDLLKEIRPIYLPDSRMYLVVGVSPVGVLVANVKTINDPTPLEVILPRNYDHWQKDMDPTEAEL